MASSAAILSSNHNLREAIERWRLHSDMQLMFRPVLNRLVEMQQQRAGPTSKMVAGPGAGPCCSSGGDALELPQGPAASSGGGGMPSGRGSPLIITPDQSSSGGSRSVNAEASGHQRLYGQSGAIGKAICAKGCDWLVPFGLGIPNGHELSATPSAPCCVALRCARLPRMPFLLHVRAATYDFHTIASPLPYARHTRVPTSGRVTSHLTQSAFDSACGCL